MDPFKKDHKIYNEFVHDHFLFFAKNYLSTRIVENT